MHHLFSYIINFLLMMSTMLLMLEYLVVCTFFISALLFFYIPVPWKFPFNLYFEWRFKYSIWRYILRILYMPLSLFNILHTYSMYITQLLVAIYCASGDRWSVRMYFVWLVRVMCTCTLPVCTTYTPSAPSWRWRSHCLDIARPWTF